MKPPFFLGLILAAWAASCLFSARAAEPTLSSGGATATPPALGDLHVLQPAAPQAFFFRTPEQAGVLTSPYGEWERKFRPLQGIAGKALNEESPSRYPYNVDFFTRFKQDHPRQLVLLHMNGNAREPRFQPEAFFAGHWLYFNGARITADVPATEGELDLAVEDATLFLVQTGLDKKSNEDVGLCVLGPDGRPDWSRSEQVQLVAVNPGQNTIRVLRGQYGTRPRAFAGGQAYAAAHATEGPWGEKAHLMWFYNFSTEAPRDPRGRSLADVLSEDIARRFLPGGELAAFDGLEFDVLWHDPLYHPDLRQQNKDGRRGPDLDADGRIDPRFIGPANSYGLGQIEFLRRLRARMGPDKLILADGGYEIMQRGFGLLNGIESEGWPNSRDNTLLTWSSGLDRFAFWRANSHPPHFNYIRHHLGKKDPWGLHRLVLAGGVFADAAFSSFAGFPEPEAAGEVGVFDELRQGTEKKLAWLGAPLGPPVRLAARQPDLLQGLGDPIQPGLLERLDSADATFALVGGRLQITARDPAAGTMHFRVRGLTVPGPDLFVSLTASCAPVQGTPPEMARLLFLGAGTGAILKPAVTPIDRWLRSHRPMQYGGLQTWVNGRHFPSSFYFRQLAGGEVELECEVESGEPLWITRLTAHAHPDATYRLFEQGLVLANPSAAPYTFDLEAIAPGRRFRRLQGSSRQDTQTNNGAPVAGHLTLPPLDALFLVSAQKP